MTGLLWHSVDPMTAAGDRSCVGVLGRLGLPAAGRARLGGDAGDGGELSATGTCAGRTCWKADLTTSITSSASELPESL